MDDSYIDIYLHLELNKLVSSGILSNKYDIFNKVKLFEDSLLQLEVIAALGKLKISSKTQDELINLLVVLFKREVSGLEIKLNNHKNDEYTEIKRECNSIIGLLNNIKKMFNLIDSNIYILDEIEEPLNLIIQIIEAKEATNLKKRTYSNYDPSAIELFNLGYYLINSKNIYNVPEDRVFINDIDFIPIYFPFYEAIQLSNYDTAMKIFERAFEIDSEFKDASLFRILAKKADAWHGREPPIEVLSELKNFCDENPTNLIALVELADAFLLNRDNISANSCIEKAEKISKNSGYLAYMKFKIAHESGNEKEEGKLLSQMSSFEPIWAIYHLWNARFAVQNRDILKGLFSGGVVLSAIPCYVSYFIHKLVSMQGRALGKEQGELCRISVERDQQELFKLERREEYYTSKYLGYKNCDKLCILKTNSSDFTFQIVAEGEEKEMEFTSENIAFSDLNLKLSELPNSIKNAVEYNLHNVKWAIVEDYNNSSSIIIKEVDIYELICLNGVPKYNQ